MMRSMILVLVLFTSAALGAAEVRVETNLAEGARGGEIELVAERVGADTIVRAGAIAGTPRPIELERGLWRVRAEAKGIWSAPAVVEIGDDPVTVVLPLYRATPVTFRIGMPKGDRAPKELNVYFGEHVVSCAIDDMRAVCDLPEGTHDLAFRVPGYVSVYEWERKIADRPIDLGTLQFRRGTTISGRVDIARSTLREMRDVEVVLTAAPDADLNELQRERAALTTVVVRPTARGFFHAVVAPGAYSVEARAKRHRSERHVVTVLEGGEAAMRDVLVLEPSRELTVSVTPPLDPTGAPWVLHLEEPKRREQRSANVSEHGTARFADLFPGTYSLSVGRNDGNAWHTEPVDVATQSFVSVSVPLTLVRGEVRLGDRPLRARLRFWDDRRNITILSRESGAFAIHLPLDEKTTTWPHIEVEADAPFLRALLEDVPIERNENGEAFLELEIASRTITGEVVDETGRRAGPALITVQNGDSGVFQVESEDGAFAFEAAATGTVSMTAMTRERETAQPYVVRNEIEDIRLVVMPTSTFRAVVQSSFGPILGASVWIAPRLPQPFVALIATEGDGAVQYRVPAGTSHVWASVAAPGFAHRLLRLPVTPEPHQILLTQSGGHLQFERAEVEGRKPYVMRNGALLSLVHFQYVARGTFVEEGVYSLCRFNDEEAAAAYAGAIHPNLCRPVMVSADGGTVTLIR